MLAIGRERYLHGIIERIRRIRLIGIQEPGRVRNRHQLTVAGQMKARNASLIGGVQHVNEISALRNAIWKAVARRSIAGWLKVRKLEAVVHEGPESRSAVKIHAENRDVVTSGIRHEKPVAVIAELNGVRGAQTVPSEAVRRTGALAACIEISS